MYIYLTYRVHRPRRDTFRRKREMRRTERSRHLEGVLDLFSASPPPKSLSFHPVIKGGLFNTFRRQVIRRDGRARRRKEKQRKETKKRKDQDGQETVDVTHRWRCIKEEVNSSPLTFFSSTSSCTKGRKERKLLQSSLYLSTTRYLHTNI